MRLTTEQMQTIRQAAVDVFGDTVSVWLFGSRTDDSKRGGDIDLLVQPATEAVGHRLRAKLRFLQRLEKGSGERKVDVVIEEPNDQRLIVRIAHETGIPL